MLRATTPDGADTQNLTLVRIVDPDTTPPQLRVDNADNQSLEVAIVTVTGNVSDPEQYGSSVASVMITSAGDDRNKIGKLSTDI